MRFAELYHQLSTELPLYKMPIECRNMKIAYEALCQKHACYVQFNSVSVFSSKEHRVVPMKFVLAELCHILAGRNDIESIASYNAVVKKYDDGLGYMAGAYGFRLQHQLPEIVARLKKDPYTRQACASIWEAADGMPTTRVNIPCNVFLQLLYRDETLIMRVVSRSSDYVTGFSIDSLQWQALAIMIANELSLLTIRRISLVYEIGSLHVYETEKVLIDCWSQHLYHPQDETLIKFTLPLSVIIHRAKTMFKGGLSIVELGNILNLDTVSMHNAVKLEELFRQHRNKVQR